MKRARFCLTLIFSLYSVAPAQNIRPYTPNPKLTPGAAFEVGRDDLCSAEYTNPARKVSVAMKGQVFVRYGIGTNAIGYNVDHLIPVSLGGSNSVTNLWPQPLSGEWNYNMKNRLEKRLHKMVCNGEMDLKKAQQEIATDWVSAYKRFIKTRANRP